MLRGAVRVLAFAVMSLVLVPWPLVAGLFGAGARKRAGSKGAYVWGRAACRILGVKVTVTGEAPAVRAIYTCNHLSYLDILVLAAVHPSVFISMVELKKWPLFGFLAKAVGTIFIDRRRTQDVDRVAREVKETLGYGADITFFPEGYASDGSKVGEFRSSLFEPAVQEHAPCVPVTLRYDLADPALDPSQLVCWHGEMEFFPHFKRLITLTGIRADVHIGAPIVVTERKEAARQLQAAVAAHFVPVRRAAG